MLHLTRLLILLSLSFLIWPQYASAEPSTHLMLQPCHLKGLSLEARCGQLTVYEDRVQKTGRQIRIRFAIAPQQGKRSLGEPLFVLAGGPGQGATQMAGLLQAGLREIHKTREIVLVDVRGTGSSNPLPCKGQQDLFTEQTAKAQMEDCKSAFDADPRFYTTPLAMQDIEDVRAALGYERIHLWGGSWGSRSALIYLRQQPGRVASVILDGPLPFENVLPLDYARDAQAVLDKLLLDCSLDSDCARAFPDLATELRTVTERLRSAQSPDINPMFWLASLRNFLYLSQHQSLIPLIIHKAFQGDFAPFHALLPEVNEWSTDTMSLGQTFSVLCSEELPRLDPGKIEAAVQGTFLGDLALKQWQLVCENWPAGVLPEDYAKPVRFDVPALILTGGIDPVTGPRWGDVASQWFSKAIHLTAPGGAHGIGHLGCLPALQEKFIRQGHLDAADTACVGQLTRQPFATGAYGVQP